MGVAARCGQSPAVLKFGGPRCAGLTVSAFGIRRTVALGGVANAEFPGTSDDDMARLQPPQELEVEWQAAEFYGHDPLFGRVFVVLSTGRGSVASVSRNAGDEFFPAINVNKLDFKLLLPRFGVELHSELPIVNRATIDRIPPFDAVYKMDAPVEYRVSRRWRGLLSRLAPRTVKVEKCKVKLMELENLDVALEPVDESGGEASFDMSITNRTSEPRVRVTWMVWPMPENHRFTCAGSVALDREPHSVRLSVPREILADERWVAVALTEPFHTDAAQAARFPAP